MDATTRSSGGVSDTPNLVWLLMLFAENELTNFADPASAEDLDRVQRFRATLLDLGEERPTLAVLEAAALMIREGIASRVVRKPNLQIVEVEPC